MSKTLQEAATEATARACHGYRGKLANHRGVSRTVVDMICTMPERNPLARVVEMHAHLRQVGSPYADELVHFFCTATGHFPPVRIDGTVGEELAGDVAERAAEILPLLDLAAQTLAAEREALTSIAAVRVRHGPHRAATAQKHERLRVRAAAGK